MAATLLALLIIVPIVEIYLFIEIGGAIGAGWTILLIFITAIYGVNAMRSQGMATLAEAQAAQAAGRPPVAAAAHGVLILLAGALLLTPGFMTDALGLSLLIRFIRSLILETALGAIMPMMGASIIRPASARPHENTPGNKPDDNVIEGDYRIDDERSD